MSFHAGGRHENDLFNAVNKNLNLLQTLAACQSCHNFVKNECVMMARRIVAISFLTLASMVMLAFAIMPHHHHQAYICFNNVHCEQEAPDGHHHDSDPVDSGHGCVRNLFQALVGRIQSLAHTCGEGHCHHFTVILFLVPDLSALFDFATGKQALCHAVYRERLYDSVYISDFPGRAPPYLLC